MPTPPDGGYFLRLDAPPASQRAPVRRAPSWQPEPRRRRRRRLRLRPLPLLGLALVAGLGYLQTRPGGVSGQINDTIDRLRGDVQEVSANPDLRRAASYFDERYDRAGSYPALSEEQIREDPTAGFGIGVDVSWCSPRAIVLQSLTAGGTVSRLLRDGKDLGDVAGRQQCPADLDHPSPWKAG